MDLPPHHVLIKRGTITWTKKDNKTQEPLQKNRNKSMKPLEVSTNVGWVPF
jgi:hypothetical protein